MDVRRWPEIADGFSSHCSSRKMAPLSRGENVGSEVPDGYLGLTLCCDASWEDGFVDTWGKDPVDFDGLPSLCWEFPLRSRFLQARLLWVCGVFRVVFFSTLMWFLRHSRPAAFSLNTPNHVITRDLFPLSEILNMPGTPELLVVGPHSIGKMERSVAVTWNGFLSLGPSHTVVLLPWCWSATRKTVELNFQRHQGLGVSTLARLSHCMHSTVSTGLQQRWASRCLASFFIVEARCALCLMAVSLRRDPRPSRPVVSKRLTDGSQVCWLETDPEGDVSEWNTGWRLIRG